MACWTYLLNSKWQAPAAWMLAVVMQHRHGYLGFSFPLFCFSIPVFKTTKAKNTKAENKLHVGEESSWNVFWKHTGKMIDKKIFNTLCPSEKLIRDWVSSTGFTKWSSYGSFSRTSQSRDHCLWVSSSREIIVSKALLLKVSSSLTPCPLPPNPLPPPPPAHPPPPAPADLQGVEGNPIYTLL